MRAESFVELRYKHNLGSRAHPPVATWVYLALPVNVVPTRNGKPTAFQQHCAVQKEGTKKTLAKQRKAEPTHRYRSIRVSTTCVFQALLSGRRFGFGHIPFQLRGM